MRPWSSLKPIYVTVLPFVTRTKTLESPATAIRVLVEPSIAALNVVSLLETWVQVAPVSGVR